MVALSFLQPDHDWHEWQRPPHSCGSSPRGLWLMLCTNRSDARTTHQNLEDWPSKWWSDHQMHDILVCRWTTLRTMTSPPVKWCSLRLWQVQQRVGDSQQGRMPPAPRLFCEDPGTFFTWQIYMSPAYPQKWWIAILMFFLDSERLGETKRIDTFWYPLDIPRCPQVDQWVSCAAWQIPSHSWVGRRRKGTETWSWPWVTTLKAGSWYSSN